MGSFGALALRAAFIRSTILLFNNTIQDAAPFSKAIRILCYRISSAEELLSAAPFYRVTSILLWRVSCVIINRILGIPGCSDIQIGVVLFN